MRAFGQECRLQRTTVKIRFQEIFIQTFEEAAFAARPFQQKENSPGHLWKKFCKRPGQPSRQRVKIGSFHVDDFEVSAFFCKSTEIGDGETADVGREALLCRGLFTEQKQQAVVKTCQVRHADNKLPAGFEETAHFRGDPENFFGVLENLIRDSDIERSILSRIRTFLYVYGVRGNPLRFTRFAVRPVYFKTGKIQALPGHAPALCFAGNVGKISSGTTANIEHPDLLRPGSGLFYSSIGSPGLDHVTAVVQLFGAGFHPHRQVSQEAHRTNFLGTFFPASRNRIPLVGPKCAVQTVTVRLEGKIVLVTGASGGIGEAAAQEAVRRGAVVILAARRADELERVAQKLRRPDGSGVFTFAADIEKERDRHRLRDFIREKTGHLDILVNNAGITAHGRFDRTDLTVLRKTMEINFFAMAELTHDLLPLMRSAPGERVILLVSTVSGLRGIPGRFAYSASKAAGHSLMETLAVELAAENFRTITFCPGYTVTALRTSGLAHDGTVLAENQAKGAVPAEVQAVRLCDALEKKRGIVLTNTTGRLMYWLRTLAPNLLDRIVARKLRSDY